MQGCLHHCDMLPFFVFVFSSAIIYFFPIFILVTFDVVCLKSVRFKHSDCLSHFFNLYYRPLNLNFLKLAQRLTDGDLESNPEPTQNDCKSPRGRPKKIKIFKGTLKKFDLSGNSNVNVASYPMIQNFFCSTIQHLNLKIVKPW